MVDDLDSFSLQFMFIYHNRKGCAAALAWLCACTRARAGVPNLYLYIALRVGKSTAQVLFYFLLYFY